MKNKTKKRISIKKARRLGRLIIIIVLCVYFHSEIGAFLGRGITLDDFKPMSMEEKHIADLRAMGMEWKIAEFYPDRVVVKR